MTGDVLHEHDYQIVGPTLEPLDLEEVKKQRRFGTATSLDTLFDIWMSAARQDLETMAGIQLLTATREVAIDAFPASRVIEIPRPPLQAVISVVYDDGSGSEQTVDADRYVVLPPIADPPTFDTYPRRGRVALVAGASWPIAADQPGSVRIRYRCGFGDAPGAVPELIVYALHLFVGTAHKYSEDLQEIDTMTRLPLGAQQVLRHAMWAAAQTVIPRRG